jgi:hypothetical protein
VDDKDHRNREMFLRLKDSGSSHTDIPATTIWPQLLTDLECGGKRSATPLWIEPNIQSAVAVPTSRDSAGALQISVARVGSSII